jgi:hypothetical protein
LLTQQFAARGVRVAYQDAKTPDGDRTNKETKEITLGRNSIKKGFHDGSIEIVVNIGTLTTGIDWDVRCIILARPTKSEMLFVQIMGRGLRTANGKDHLLVLDHSTNHLNLGFVTDIDVLHTQLAKGEAKTENVTDKIRLPKECPACHFMKPPGTAKCPVCKFVATAHSKITPTAGELKELERQKKADKENIDRGAFLAELKAYGERKGFKPGWAANKYREKFGVWPNNEIARVAPQAGVSEAAIGWIQRCNIAWLKSKHRFAS